MAFRTLISTDVLAARLGDPAFTIVDCRFRLDDVAWGERDYHAGHIPGALYAHIDRDLSAPKTGTNGRHPLPDAGVLTATFSRMGITSGRQVVAYDQDTGMFASRLWWLLRWLGHDAVAVLDGGWAKWIGEGRPIATGEERAESRVFEPRTRAEMIVVAGDVLAHMNDPGWRLIDARAPERYRGETEPIDPVAGHIPGAVNHFYLGNLDERGTFRTPEALRSLLGEFTSGVPAERVVSYCGSGVTACHNLLALEHAGISGTKLYTGSWSEWLSDPERPVATGPALTRGGA
jgi:thiosulfate/3-mercaptopyruvate sulfurtransferase